MSIPPPFSLPLPLDMSVKINPVLGKILASRCMTEYDPLWSDIKKWNQNMGDIFGRYGVSDIERPQRAAMYIKGEFGVQLREVLRTAQAEFGFVRWAEFTKFMVAFDRTWNLIVTIDLSKDSPTGRFQESGYTVQIHHYLTCAYVCSFIE